PARFFAAPLLLETAGAPVGQPPVPPDVVVGGRERLEPAARFPEVAGAPLLPGELEHRLEPADGPAGLARQLLRLFERRFDVVGFREKAHQPLARALPRRRRRRRDGHALQRLAPRNDRRTLRHGPAARFRSKPPE